MARFAAYALLLGLCVAAGYVGAIGDMHEAYFVLLRSSE